MAERGEKPNRVRQSKYSVELELPDILPLFRRIDFLSDDARWVRDVLKRLKLDKAQGMEWDFLLEGKPKRKAKLRLVAYRDDIEVFDMHFSGHPALVKVVRSVSRDVLAERERDLAASVQVSTR